MKGNVAMRIDITTLRVLVALLVVWICPSQVQGQDRTLAPGLGFTRDFEAQYPLPVYSMAVHDDGTGPQLYLGGAFQNYVIGYLPFMSRNITRWNGRTWDRVGWGVNWTTETVPPGADPGVHALCSYDDGTGAKLYVAGVFSRYWSTQQGAWLPCAPLLAWDGSDFQTMPLSPPPFPSLPTGVQDMAVFDDGSGSKLYFADRGSLYVWRWDGQSWSQVGTGAPFLMGRLCVHDDGHGAKLYATGVWPSPTQPTQGFSAWDGVSWSEVPVPFQGAIGGEVQGLVSIDHGSGPSLYLARNWGELWRYRSGVWDRVLNSAHDHHIAGLASFDDGNGPALYVFGNRIVLPTAPDGMYTRIARFDGDAWTAIGPLSPTLVQGYNRSSQAIYDFGEGEDLYVGGAYTGSGGQSTHGLERYRGVHRALAAVCGGDGSLTRCPCNTRGAVGHGCPNSTSTAPYGARLEGSGTTAADTLRLRAERLPQNALALLYQGDAYAYEPILSGDGVRCTTGTMLRMGTRTAQGGAVEFPGAGEPSLRARAASQGDQLAPGSVRYYQVWYRDPDPAFCSSGGLFNTTNGMRVEW